MDSIYENRTIINAIYALSNGYIFVIDLDTNGNFVGFRCGTRNDILYDSIGHPRDDSKLLIKL